MTLKEQYEADLLAVTHNMKQLTEDIAQLTANIHATQGVKQYIEEKLRLLDTESSTDDPRQ